MNFDLEELEEIKMTQTGLIPGKKGSVVHVCFERSKDKETNYAEVIMPSCRVISNKGFQEEEIEQLRIYLKAHKQDILVAAKKINHDLLFKL